MRTLTLPNDLDARDFGCRPAADESSILVSFQFGSASDAGFAHAGVLDVHWR